MKQAEVKKKPMKQLLVCVWISYIYQFCVKNNILGMLQLSNPRTILLIQHVADVLILNLFTYRVSVCTGIYQFCVKNNIMGMLQISNPKTIEEELFLTKLKQTDYIQSWIS